ncbi:MAG: HAD family hydrolase [Chloroflexi bacterium]|nr:HAD family hydrolase [Chloroflexota bacterium]
MLKAVLFDLDNTLIHFSERRFAESYFARIASAFADIMPADKLLERLFISTQLLMNNNGEMSNADHFMNSFSSGLDIPRDKLWKRFIDFYEAEFDRFRDIVSVPDGVRDMLLNLKRKRVKLVIASNPMWPSIVQMKRLAWGGIDDIKFDLVTDIENMSYCKPRLEYYLEVCRKIALKPDECLMVGNDPVNDMIVASIGMKTYLVTDEGVASDTAIELSKKIRSNKTYNIPKPDFEGPLTAVPAAVDSLLRM